MKGLVFSFFIGICLIGCSKSIEKPENLISQEQVELILTDVHLYQQPTYLTSIYDQSINQAKIDAQILAKHQVSPKIFEESFEYYVLHPEIFKEILTNVRKNLMEKLPKEERERMEQAAKEVENTKK